MKLETLTLKTVEEKLDFLMKKANKTSGKEDL